MKMGEEKNVRRNTGAKGDAGGQKTKCVVRQVAEG